MVATNEVVSFTSGSIGASSYSWNFGDGTSSSLQNPTHAFAQPGNYTVTLTVDSSGCGAGTTAQSIDVTGPLGIQSVGGNTDRLSYITNQDGVFLQLNFNRTVNGTITVYDLLGNVLMREDFSGSNDLIRIPLPHEAAGVYLIESRTPENMLCKRIVRTN